MATLTARAPRRIGAPIVLILPALLFGLLVSVQWRTQLERSELSVRYNAPLLDAARSLQSEQEVLKKQLADLRAQLDEIQRGAASQSTASRDLQAQIEDLRSAAGLTERTGDGVQIVLDDAHTTVTAPAANVDKSICHSTDLTDIINAAWRGGAQAIAVNGERVVGSTSVYCVGSTIMVNGTLMSPAFTISVIGPQNELLGAYDDPNELKDVKQRRDVYGLGFRVTRASGLRVPAYAGALNVKYATPTER
ncbi:MAG: DUF881 domain-containing protein [Chloroflexi bacterium]|nr:MAG: DUF881 domain-containing protein [Chloroflexota bacterium]TMC35092.1 MAG: DUF881 domain-containing protein [Chloroflexota bacterium]TMC52607.1 MAG: DUF881 domain-containing protein [Chloroflexota bacterium]